MGKEEKFADKIGRDTGMRVPEGYFDSFREAMMSSLPPYPKAPEAQKLTLWQRVKPYVYMAAMFAGIWCMMKMFHMSMENAGVLDAPSSEVVAAIQNPDVYDYYMEVDDSDMSDIEVERSVSEAYDNMEEFTEDFGYQLKPEYASLEVHG